MLPSPVKQSAEDFPTPTRAGSSLEFISSCWFGRISLWETVWAAGAAWTLWDTSLLCSWSCPGPPESIPELLPSPGGDTEHAEQNAQADGDYCIIPSKGNVCAPLDPGHTSQNSHPASILGEHSSGHGTSSSYKKCRRKWSYILLVSQTWL